jgi:hypothetical protein
MADRRGVRRFLGPLALAASVTFWTGAGQAADITEPLGPETMPEDAGVVCTLNDPFSLAATAASLPWRSVWLGHFSGGRPYSDGFGRIYIDWRDEKVCFASEAACRAWLRELRKHYSDPEGWVTCMLLR